MKQAERVAKTKASLAEAFWKLYRQKPLNQISVREITDAAGVYRSTFYLYFQDAATVLAQLEDELEERLAKLLETAPAKSMLEDIPALIALFYKKEGSYLYPLLGTDGDRTFAERIFALMRPAIEENSELSGDDFERAFRFACEGSLGLIASCYKQRRATPLEKVAETGHKIIAGVGTSVKEPQPFLAESSNEAEAAPVGSEEAETATAAETSTDAASADEPEGATSAAAAEPEEPIAAAQPDLASKPKPVTRKRKKAAKKAQPAGEPSVEKPEDDDIQMALF